MRTFLKSTSVVPRPRGSRPSELLSQELACFMLIPRGATRIACELLRTVQRPARSPLLGSWLAQVWARSGVWASSCISGSYVSLDCDCGLQTPPDHSMQRTPLGSLLITGTPPFWKTQSSGRSVPVGSLKRVSILASVRRPRSLSGVWTRCWSFSSSSCLWRIFFFSGDFADFERGCYSIVGGYHPDNGVKSFYGCCHFCRSCNIQVLGHPELRHSAQIAPPRRSPRLNCEVDGEIDHLRLTAAGSRSSTPCNPHS